jgi:hypothetical protein
MERPHRTLKNAMEAMFECTEPRRRYDVHVNEKCFSSLWIFQGNHIKRKLDEMIYSLFNKSGILFMTELM